MREIDDPEACNCKLQCFDKPGCACIYVHDLGLCTCDCGDEGGAVFAPGSKLGANARVSICTKNIPLVRLGQLLSQICAAELAIPASKVARPISLSIKKTTIGNVMKEAGLVVLEKEVIRSD